MKKVGIMTMHRVINYGSFLQAYGLKKLILDLGHEVIYVDFKFEKDILNKSKKDTLFFKLITHLNVIKYLKKKISLKRFEKKYIDNLLKIGIDKMTYNPDVDTLVIGSDEVFNCLQHYPVGYSRNLFGYEYEKSNVISYAASFGHTKLDELKSYGIDSEIGDMLINFNAISVRDKNSYEIVKNLSHKEPFIHFDPVLVSNYENEIANIKTIVKNYVIIYAYTDRLSKKEEKYVKYFAKKYNKKVISLGFYQQCADYNLVVDPFEALKYIKDADYVITDTFHGTVFSIKLNTKFCTIIRESNKNKLLYLLDSLKQSSRVVNELNDIERLFFEDIDFENSNNIIKIETTKSIEYLKNKI